MPPETTPPTTTPPTTTTDPLPASGIRTAVLNLVDASRPTISHGRRLAPWRVLTTEVWYPTAPAVQPPLVVFIHGYRLGLAPYRRFCLALARRGFVVAAPRFVLSDQAAAGALIDEADIVNEPADVSFVITQLLAANAGRGQPLGELIDPAQIALVGHSDGATVAVELAYLPAVRDPRIRVVVADAPDALPLPVGSPPIISSVLLLLVHGDRDTVVPISASQHLMTQIRTPGWSLVLRGASHLVPIQGPSPWTDLFDSASSDFIRGVFTAKPNLGLVLKGDIAAQPASLTALSTGR
jgi:pimeloyl-ACP methyl ester carboxylesterase